MKINSRAILTALVLLAVLVALLLVLVLAEKLLNIWHFLQTAPVWVVGLYLFALLAVSALGLWLWLSLVRIKPRTEKIEAIDESSLSEKVRREAARGVDVSEAEAELEELHRRRGQGDFHIALYGTVSSGKSSFIQALFPDQPVDIDVRSGTTREIRHYRHNNLEIIDLPGLDDPKGDVDHAALEETLRAHVVVFLTDSDLTRTETRVLEKLKRTGKPLVMALNKADRYNPEEQSQLIGQLKKRSGDQIPLAVISTGGTETVVYRDAKGQESRKLRQQPARIKPLLEAIERVVANNPDALNRFRDAAMLMLAAEKLDRARQAHNRQEAERIIRHTTRNAVLGAMAAITPGSDLIIQGTLATRMVRQICDLYGVSPKQMEIDRLIKLAGGKLKTSASVLLAVAGNALKSFPGMGTAAGGAMHAVAYGILFNALGKAVAETVASLGTLDEAVARQKFEENLFGNSERLARDLAKVALKALNH